MAKRNTWSDRLVKYAAEFEWAYEKYKGYRNDKNFRFLSNAFGDFMEAVEDMERDYYSGRQLTMEEFKKYHSVHCTVDDFTIRYFTESGRRQAIAEIKNKLSTF